MQFRHTQISYLVLIAYEHLTNESRLSKTVACALSSLDIFSVSNFKALVLLPNLRALRGPSGSL